MAFRNEPSKEKCISLNERQQYEVEGINLKYLVKRKEIKYCFMTFVPI